MAVGVDKLHPLFTDYFDQYLFRPASVEFTVKDLFPGAEVQLASGDGHDYLAAHDLPFEMGIGIVFVAVMAILLDRFMGRQTFQPLFVVVMQAGFALLGLWPRLLGRLASATRLPHWQSA